MSVPTGNRSGIDLRVLSKQSSKRHNLAGEAGGHRRREASMSSSVIFVRRAGRGSVVGNLRPAGMRHGQWRGQGDAGAGDLRARRVRQSERRGDGDGGANRSARASTAPADRGDNRGLRMRATVNDDGLAGTESHHAGDRDHGRARLRCRAHRGGARRAHRRDCRRLEVRAGIDQNRLAGVKACHAADLDIGRARG